MYKGERPKAADWLAAVVTVLSSLLDQTGPLPRGLPGGYFLGKWPSDAEKSLWV